jgi:CheY-like chemotaxis protein
MTRPEDKTILVVDDEEDIREFLSTVLEDVGFNVVTAADGVEALERVQMSPPDFISLDLVMPKKSGNRFLYDLRKRQEWRDIPVVVVTSHAHDDIGRKDFEDIFSNKKLSGPQFHLEKPVDPEQYVGLICEKLRIEFDGEPAESDSDRLRSELHRLIEEAPPSKLSQILRALKSMS